MTEFSYAVRRATIEVDPGAQERFLAWLDKQNLGELPPSVAVILAALGDESNWSDGRSDDALK